MIRPSGTEVALDGAIVDGGSPVINSTQSVLTQGDKQKQWSVRFTPRPTPVSFGGARSAVSLKSRLLPRLAALGVAAWLVLSWADAQDFKKVVPSLPAQEKPTVTTPPVTDEASQDQTVLAPRLAGVVFVDGLPALRADGLAAGEVSGGVRADGLPVLADEAFLAKIRPLVGQPLTRAGLDQIVRQAREAHRAVGRPFMEIVAPPQNVSSGVIQIVVTEYHVGQVEVVGGRHFSPDLIRRWGDLTPGEVMTLPRFRDALEDYNQNPFATVDAVLSLGAQTGVSDVTLQVEDRSPWRVYAGYDNLGSRTLGRAEWNVGVNWGNAFGTGQILSYQYTRSVSGRYDSHSVSDVIPCAAATRSCCSGPTPPRFRKSPPTSTAKAIRPRSASAMCANCPARRASSRACRSASTTSGWTTTWNSPA